MNVTPSKYKTALKLIRTSVFCRRGGEGFLSFLSSLLSHLRTPGRLREWTGFVLRHVVAWVHCVDAETPSTNKVFTIKQEINQSLHTYDFIMALGKHCSFTRNNTQVALAGHAENSRAVSMETGLGSRRRLLIWKQPFWCEAFFKTAL